MQLGQQFGRDPLGLAMRHAVNHPVPDGFDGSEERLDFEPVQQRSDSRMRIAGIDGAAFLQVSVRVTAGQVRAAKTNAIHDSSEHPPQRSDFIV
jgi:hypothetical protein